MSRNSKWYLYRLGLFLGLPDEQATTATSGTLNSTLKASLEMLKHLQTRLEDGSRLMCDETEGTPG
jgi:hypothetical protein